MENKHKIGGRKAAPMEEPSAQGSGVVRPDSFFKKQTMDWANAIIDSELSEFPTAKRFADELRSDRKIRAFQNQSNTMTVKRMNYNDHGPVHSLIVTANALRILKIFEAKGAVLSSIRDNYNFGREEARIIVVGAAFLHDVGNCVHREKHEYISIIIFHQLIDDILTKFFPDEQKKVSLLCDILHGLLAHDEDIEALTTEAGIVKIADGTDCTEGRSRIPYKLGDYGIHSMSARSISDVVLTAAPDAKILRIEVKMKDATGIFQIEEILMKKIKTSGLADKVEVVATVETEKDKEIRF